MHVVALRIGETNGSVIHNKLLFRKHYFDITILQMNKHNDSRLIPHIFQ